MKTIKSFTILLFFIGFSNKAISQQSAVSKIGNVVYGMVSGTSLLMDVYVSPRSNGKAIVFIPGSGWGFGYPTNYDQVQLKEDVTLDSNYIGKCVKSLAENGYTVFVINHRFTPKFLYQDIIEDCRRAVRFIKYHAREFNIDSLHVGAMGLSSGGNLVSLLGMPNRQKYNGKSAIDRLSSKVDAVVTLAAPFNLADLKNPEDSAMDNGFVLEMIEAYMGNLPELKNGHYILSGHYLDASPYSLVTKDAAPTLIYYSDDDPVIPTRQAREMFAKLREDNVDSKIFEKKGEGHSPIPDMKEVCNWFEKHLN